MKLPKRILVSLLIALPLLGALLLVSQAGAQGAPVEAPQPDDCAGCHQEFQDAWQGGKHSQAGTNKAFLEAWAAQGQPTACLACHSPGYDAASGSGQESGITCQACHGAAQADHPITNMQVDTTGKLCATCHTQPRAAEGQPAGAHDRAGMPCITCHDPHSNDFQTPPTGQIGPPVNPSALCENCHREIAVSAVHSAHSAANVSCSDCHMGARAEGNADPHIAPDHTGNATLETCNACHSTQMHASTGVPITVEPTPATPGPLSAGLIDTSPQAPGPLGYIVISVLVGLAFGFVLAPMIERSSKRRKGGK